MPEQLRDRVRWDLDKGVARVTMARPEAGNALDMAMARALGEAADRVERGAADGSVRVAVLAAEGKSFCVGGDLRDSPAPSNGTCRSRRSPTSCTARSWSYAAPPSRW